MKNLKTNLSVAVFAFLFVMAGSFLYSQDAPEAEPPQQQEVTKSDDAPAAAAAPAKEVRQNRAARRVAADAQARGERKSEKEKKKEEKAVPQAEETASGLLEITEGDFKYARIPERKSVPMISESISIGQENAETAAPAAGENRQGLFGLSPGASNRLAVGVLVSLIVIIFLLYRIRSRSRNSSVLKRFP